MSMPSSIEPFLQSVQKAAQDFEAIRADGTLIPLLHPFWSYEQIVSGLDIKEEWDVDDDLVPFYGDWHDLMCISQRTGAISLIDDDRTSLFTWTDSDAFLGALTHESPGNERSSQAVPIEAHFSDELTALIEQSKR